MLEKLGINTELENLSKEVENEIKEFCWIDRNYKEKGIKVGSILGKFVLPQLRKRELI